MRGMTVEAVDEDNVDQRRSFGAVDLGEAIRLDLFRIRHVFLREKRGCEERKGDKAERILKSGKSEKRKEE